MGLHFTKEEFTKRKVKVLSKMKEQNIDALLMFRQESMYWLTGYDTFGYVFFQSLILDQKGNVILLTRAPDLRQAQNTSNIDDIRIWVDKDDSNPTDDLKIILNELNLKGKNLGVEYEAYGLTGRNALRLNKSLENYCSIEDKSELITKLRVVKSNEEIEYVRKAAHLADLALDEAWKHAKTGVSESKIKAEDPEKYYSMINKPLPKKYLRKNYPIAPVNAYVPPQSKLSPEELDKQLEQEVLERKKREEALREKQQKEMKEKERKERNRAALAKEQRYIYWCDAREQGNYVSIHSNKFKSRGKKYEYY